MTHRAVLTTPLVPGKALEHARAWMMRSNVEPLEPGERHLDILDNLLNAIGTGGNSGLRWRNPLSGG